MLIDIDYFKGALQLPNIEKDEESFIANYIERYEKEVLIKLLGNDLYQQVIENYDTEVDDKWRDLVEGKDFIVTVSGIDYTVKWNGLINSEEISLIAYYVYYNYLDQNFQQTTGLGVGAQNMANATVITPNKKLVWAWNECRSLSGHYDYVTTGTSLSYTSIEPTLFNFIINHIEDYTPWVYNPIKQMNVLGI